jgi:hypothetical protein
MNQYFQRNYIIAAVAIICVVIVVTGGLYLSQAQKSSQAIKEPTPPGEVPMVKATSTPVVPTKKTTTVKPALPVSASQSYVDALKTYASRKVQMSHCLATPNKMIFKNNTELMFDNRDSVAIDLKIDGKTNTISALGYKIITFSSKTLPHAVDIDCYSGGKPTYNVATVTLVQ